MTEATNASVDARLPDPTTDARAYDPSRNARQRKLAVMRRCDVITNDAKYEGTGKRQDGTTYKINFDYVSIQMVSNSLRKIAAEEGLDVDVYPDPEALGSLMVVDLVNVDDPNLRVNDDGHLIAGDYIRHRWPMHHGDKGWAYSTKYPLVRTFLIGDGAAPDEAEMANQGPAQPRQRSSEPPPAPYDDGPAPSSTATSRQPAAAPPPPPPVDHGAGVPAATMPRGADGKLPEPEFAARWPLYQLARQLGKGDGAEAYVDDLLENPRENGDRVSRGNLKRKLDSMVHKQEKAAQEAAETAREEHRAANPEPAPEAAPPPAPPAEEPKDEKILEDPEVLVCPHCRSMRQQVVRPKAGSPGVWTCFAGAGGCSRDIGEGDFISRRVFDARKLADEAIAKGGAVEEIRELAQAAGLTVPAEPIEGACLLCNVKDGHAVDCFSLEARKQRGEVIVTGGAAS